MKSIRKSPAPPELAEYVAEYPQASWETLSDEYRSLKELIGRRLRSDQGGLCCYCEIDLVVPANRVGLPDFRVEHFHPKSDRSDATRNWALEWSNLLGCCHGGSARDVAEAEQRFAKDVARDSSCDVPKGEHNWDDSILNPLDLPPTPALFDVHRTTGELSVHQPNCERAGIDPEKAQEALVKLNLNSRRLTPFRQRITHDLNHHLQAKLAEGLDIATATRQLAEAFLRQDQANNWPAFFTTIRSYLGPSAEQHLQSIGYVG